MTISTSKKAAKEAAKAADRIETARFNYVLMSAQKEKKTIIAMRHAVTANLNAAQASNDNAKIAAAQRDIAALTPGLANRLHTPARVGQMFTIIKVLLASGSYTEMVYETVGTCDQADLGAKVAEHVYQDSVKDAEEDFAGDPSDVVDYDLLAGQAFEYQIIVEGCAISTTDCTILPSDDPYDNHYLAIPVK